MNKHQLIKQIKEKELQIKRLDFHKTSSEVCGQLYNTLILEKAILKKELENMKKNPIIESVKKVLPKKQKLICDYFKS